MKKRYAISRASVDNGVECAKSGKPAKELSTEKRLGKPAEPLSHGNDAWINATRMEESLFFSDGWLSTSTGSSISMKALQQEEAI